MIPETRTNTEAHLNDPDDNGEFSCRRIGEDDLVSLPIAKCKD